MLGAGPDSGCWVGEGAETVAAILLLAKSWSKSWGEREPREPPILSCHLLKLYGAVPICHASSTGLWAADFPSRV